MSLRELTVVVAAIAAAGVLSTAQAAPITGGISFSDGLSTFGTSTSIVSQLNAIDDDAATPETASSCSGSFVPCTGVTGPFAFDFNIANGTQHIYSYNGFDFYLQTITGSPIRTALTCANGGCGDALVFFGQGVVFGPAGFDPTIFTITFTAQGNCNQDVSGAQQCDPTNGQVTASWSSSITSTGRPFQTPEPGSMALIGVGLLGLGLARRRRS